MSTDFLQLTIGLGLGVLATLIGRARRPGWPREAWGWLVGFGLLQGLHAWAVAVVGGWEDSGMFRGFRGLLWLASCSCLLEFVRIQALGRGTARQRAAGHALVAAVAAVGAAVLDWSTWMRCGTWMLGLPATILAAGLLWRHREGSGTGGRWRVGVLGMLANGVGAAVVDGAWGEHGSLAGAWVRAMGAVLAVAGWWMPDGERDSTTGVVRWFRRWATAVSLAGIWAAAGLGAYWAERLEDDRVRDALMSHIAAVERAIQPERVQALEFRNEDLQKPEYHRLTEQLQAVATVAGFRGIYSLAERGGELVFGPGSRGSAERATTAPGTVYRDAPRELREVFRSGRTRVFGPYRDDRGTFVSCWSPVLAVRTREPVMVIGGDLGYREWRATMDRVRVPPLLFAMALSALALGTHALLRWRERWPAARQRRWRHVEVVACGAGGVVLALAVAAWAHDLEKRSRRDAYRVLAEAEGQRVAGLLEDLRGHLDSMARFFAGSVQVDRGEFRQFARVLAMNGSAQAWCWVPVVPRAEREAFERDARAAGREGFQIHEQEPDGTRRDPGSRESYHPIALVEPEAPNASVLGFDLGSLPVLRAALEEAARTGLGTATDFLGAGEAPRGLGGVAAVQAVSAPDVEAGAGGVKGFVVAMVPREEIVRMAASGVASRMPGLQVGVHRLDGASGASALATSSALPGMPAWAGGARMDALVETVPLFLFGKSYGVELRAGAEYLAAHPLGQGWVAAALGLAVTGLLTGFTGLLVLRRSEWELAAEVRTAQLRQSEESYRRQFSESSAVMLLVDPWDGRLLDANEAARGFYGYTREELLARTMSDLSVDPPEVVRATMAAVAREKGSVFTLRQRLSDGQLRHVEACHSPIHVGDRLVLHVIVFDVTRRCLAEAEMAALNQQLEEATAKTNAMAMEAALASIAKSEFLANMSHEIRTPMNGVIGMTHLLLDTGLTAEQRRIAETIGASAESLLQVINDILDFSKIEAGRLELEETDFEPRRLLDELAAPLALRAGEKGLRFECAIAPEVPRIVRGDAGRLRQILTNLAGNAVKFTEAGEVGLSLVHEADSGDRVRLRFTVRDTGMGIPEDKLELLFRKFSQVDASITRTHGGTGLGLAISKQLVELMGGQIGVRSRVGHGSEFWFVVEMRKSANADRPVDPVASADVPPESADLPGAGEVRVLLAEDNLTNQQVALGMLRKLGVRARAVGNGADAVHAVSEGECDLVLMDVQMPLVDGLEATRRIRRWEAESGPPGRRIPVIAMTAHALQRDRDLCLAAGMDDYLTKPVVFRALRDVLRHWLPAPGSGTPPERTPVATAVSSHLEEAPTEVAVASLPVYDRAGFLERVMNDEEMVRLIEATFLDDLPRQLATLDGHVARGEAVEAGALAHAIKGAAANVGGEAMRAVAYAMEQAGKRGDADALVRLLPELRSQYDLLAAAMSPDAQDVGVAAGGV